jgi:hypothetical protein
VTRVAWYETPTGARLELHHRPMGIFWTERVDEAGRSVVACDTLRAREHYELAEREGHVEAAFPYRVRVVA